MGWGGQERCRHLPPFVLEGWVVGVPRGHELRYPANDSLLDPIAVRILLVKQDVENHLREGD